MQKNHKQIARSLPVRDAFGKVTGGTCYVNDMKRQGLLHGQLLLSHVAHGKILKIHLDDALSVPGVIQIYTYLNTPDTLYNGAAPFEEHHFPCQEKMFSPVLRFFGDRIALVVAQNREAARQASRKIQVEIEPLPFVLDPLKALDSDAPLLQPEGNLCGICQMETGSWEKALAGADQVVETSFNIPPYHHGALETHGVLAELDTHGDLIIHTPSQNIFAVRFMTADLLKLPQSRVRVIRAPMGGSFGGKLEMILEPLVAYACYDLKQPVKLVLDRRETMVASRVSYGLKATLRSAISDGAITGLDLDLVADAGAYLSSGEDFIWAMSGKAFRLYKIPSIRYCARVALTNKPVASAMRGYGSTQLVTALEVHMDRVANVLGTDPLDLRWDHCFQKDDPDPRTGNFFGRASVEAVLGAGADAFGEPVGKAWSDMHYFYGTGMSLGVHGNGMYPVHFDTTTMALKMNRDGSVNLVTGTVDMGTGTTTAYTQIVAEVLGLDAENIGVVEGDTATGPFDLGCYASRSIAVSGEAARKVAVALAEKLVDAAQSFGLSQGPLQFKEGKVCGQDGKAVPFAQLAQWMMTKRGEDLYVCATHSSNLDPMSYGAHFAKVRVCRKTGAIEVLRYCAAHDPGRSINPDSLAGQIQGAIGMGVGMALWEGLEWDTQGRMKNRSLGAYRMAFARDMPDIQMLFLENPEKTGPFGARSIGEISAVPVPAAVTNAVARALGMNITSLPLQRQKLLDRMKEVEDGRKNY